MRLLAEPVNERSLIADGTSLGARARSMLDDSKTRIEPQAYATARAERAKLTIDSVFASSSIADLRSTSQPAPEIDSANGLKYRFASKRLDRGSTGAFAGFTTAAAFRGIAAPLVLLWVYVSAIGVLLGAELNAEIERIWLGNGTVRRTSRTSLTRAACRPQVVSDP